MTMKKLMMLLLAMAQASFITTSQAAESSLAKQFEALAADMYETANEKQSPGAFVMVVKGDLVIHNKGYGYADLAHQVPISDQTKFDLASIAKMFTGYAIAYLVEEGRIKLDDEIQTYLPDFPRYEHKITVAHLVHHSSGIRNWTEFLTLAGWSFDDSISFDQILSLIYAQEGLDFEPGTQYKYSNSGYNLLAEIVERVTGSSFVNWTHEHIFAPLQMHNTFFNDQQNRVIPHLATGYYRDNHRNERRAFNNLTAVGSSSLFSDASDMQKWMRFLLRPPHDKKHVVQRMFTTRKLANGEHNSYGFGIDVASYQDTDFIGHSGSWASNTSYLLILPEHEMGIFIVHNFRTPTQRRVELFADLLLQKSGNTTTSSSEPGITLSNEQLDRLVGKYKLGVAWYVTISKDNNQLYAQANGEPAFLMQPISENVFQVPAYGNRKITFLPNEQGQVDAFEYIGMHCPKQQETELLDLKKLAGYQGIYYNKELGTLFEILLVGQQLVGHNHKSGKLQLHHEQGDEFYGEGHLRRLMFTRDDEQRINGFYIANYRGKKQWEFSLIKPPAAALSHADE